MCMHNHQGECLRATNKKIGFLHIILGFVLLGYLVLYCSLVFISNVLFIYTFICNQFYQFNSIWFSISTITLIFIKCFAFIDMRINFYKSKSNLNKSFLLFNKFLNLKNLMRNLLKYFLDIVS